jgi:hypothetical protein
MSEWLETLTQLTCHFFRHVSAAATLAPRGDSAPVMAVMAFVSDRIGAGADPILRGKRLI